MGAAESVIRNADKRTSRRENRETFAEGIEAFRAGWEDPSERLGPDGRASPRPQDEEQVVRVCVRKRPMFEREVQQGEFDVVSCARSQLVIHDARMGPDMKARFLDNNVFSFNEVFSEHDSSDKVFDTVVAPLVTIVRKGGNGTALMYGQTGSGKTFTMTNAYKRASEAFFKDQPGLPSLSQVFVSFVELAGDSVHDVLNKHAKLQLLSCPNGNVLAYPGVQVPVTSAEELHSCITFACSLRATAATGVHDQSSRSHALCRIELPNGNALTLVDLAGSEHRIDSAEHDAQRRKEGAQINSSLMKLKECVRARAQNATYIPYRQSKLTHLLRPAFVEDTGTVSRTIIIATVSPSSKDTEHSLNTVRHACIMDGQEQDSKETRWITGGKTSRQHLAPVNVTMLAKKKKAQRDALRKGKGGKPGHGEGGGWGAAPPPQHSRDGSFDSTARKAALKKQNAEVERARRQAEVASVKLLPNHMRALLKQARESAGELQRARVNELQQHVRAAEARAANEARAAERKKKTKPERRPLTKPVVQEALHQPVRENSPNARQVCTLTPPHVDMAAPTKLHQDVDGGRHEPCVDKPSPPKPEVVASPQQPSPRRTMSWDEMRQDIRERVWADPRVPDDMKEEQIVDICRALKTRLGLGSDATNNSARTPSNSGETMQSFGLTRAGGAESSFQTPEAPLGRAGGAAIDSTSHWEEPVNVGHESPSPFPGSRSEEESRSYNPERYEPDRHERARRAREELIDAKKRKAEAKLSAKMNKSSVDTLGTQTLDDLKQHLALREADFQRETDSMKRFGLKKQVEKARAAVIRLERKQKQAQADASRGLQPQQALEPSPRGAVQEPCVT